MIKMLVRALGVMLVAATIVVPGQTQPGLSTVEQQVLAVDNGYWDAVNACDVDKWDALVSDDIMLLTVSGVVYDKEILRPDHFGPIPPCIHNYTIEPLRIRVYGDTAVVNGNFVYGGGTAAYTRVFHRENGRWRVVLVHHSAVEEPMKANGRQLVTSCPEWATSVTPPCPR